MSDHSTFADRHIGLDSQAVATMLAVIGVDSLDDLAVKAVPAGILDTLTDTGAARVWTVCHRLPAKPRRWPSCERWPTLTPSPCR